MKIAQTRKLHAAGILPNPSPTKDLQALTDRLEALRLMYAAEALESLISQSVKEDWSSIEFLDALVRAVIEPEV